MENIYLVVLLVSYKLVRYSKFSLLNSCIHNMNYVNSTIMHLVDPKNCDRCKISINGWLMDLVGWMTCFCGCVPLILHDKFINNYCLVPVALSFFNAFHLLSHCSLKFIKDSHHWFQMILSLIACYLNDHLLPYVPVHNPFPPASNYHSWACSSCHKYLTHFLPFFA